ncbi:prephenate dehydrogenase/arogenate dehydrogenase family protein [Candidatus Solincola sp.]|nr:prephenate dehydrogenase [Actinomycetota bacterium]MDI7251637.1 prephenate dehydrogenase [Actinomycetota bacterium]
MSDLLYERVGIVGTGLIGGSLGLAMQASGAAGKVLGSDVDAEMLERALKVGAVQEAFERPEEMVPRCDLVLVAVPVRAIPGVLERIAPFLRPGTTVSDVGSVKEGVVKAAARILPSYCHFVGGHPLAGSEQRGVEFADPDLFRETYYVLTPTRECDAEAYSRLHALLTSLGARVIAMEPRLHDRAVSVVSHVPHVMAMALMNLALRRAEEFPLLRLAAGGFRDVTRIAASDPRLWLDILAENREAVCETLEEVLGNLERIRDYLRAGRETELFSWLERASVGRRNLAPALRESLGEMYLLTLPVEDRPGVISEVTLTVGDMGINIDDLELVHPLESGQGILRLSITGEENARRAMDALRARGYRVTLGRAMGEH